MMSLAMMSTSQDSVVVMVVAVSAGGGGAVAELHPQSGPLTPECWLPVSNAFLALKPKQAQDGIPGLWGHRSLDLSGPRHSHAPMPLL